MSAITKGKVLAKKKLFTSKYFSIERRNIERADGRAFTKDFFVRRPVVMVIPFTKEGEIYVEYQYRDAFHKEIYEVVAGHTEEHETDMLEAAKRELQEETGITGTKWIHLAEWELGANMNAPIHLFAVTDLTMGDSLQDEDEEIQTVKMPISEVITKVETGEFMIGANIAAILFFEHLRKTGRL